MVDLGAAHLDYLQRHMRHIGLLVSQEVPVCLRGVASSVAYPCWVVRRSLPPTGPSTARGSRRTLRLGAGVIRLLLFVGVAGTVGGLAVRPLLPPVGGVSLADLAARSCTDSFDSLPEALRRPVLAQQSRILASDGSLITTFYTQNRITVPL